MEINRHTDPAGVNRQRMRTRTRKRFLSGFNSSLATLLLFILVVMLNFISSRNYLRVDLTRDQFYKLSDKTESMLKSLPGQIRITVFIQPGHELYNLVYDDVINLLKEYEYAGGIHIETDRVDPDRNISLAEEIMTRYQLDEPNVIIFEHGERRKIVSANELMELDYTPVAQGAPPEKVSFRGEQVFSSAILSITQAKRPKVYFLQGHGERNFDDRDEYVGLSTIGQTIRRDDLDIESFSFIQKNTIPEDADAVIIAGPTRQYASGELERIAAYVNRNGRLILMLNSETDAGFGPLLNTWGVESMNNIVVDPTRTLSGFDLLVADYDEHPITTNLKNITTVFYWPRALPLSIGRPVESRDADEPKATVIARSSVNAWAERDLEQRPYRFDTDSDIKGPVPVALAIEKGSEASLVMDIRSTRVVLFGDVDFVSNSGLSGGNSDLFMNSLNWILERDALMAVSARSVDQLKLMITQRQLSSLFWCVVVGIPALAATLGVLVWWRRRN